MDYTKAELAQADVELGANHGMLERILTDYRNMRDECRSISKVK